MELAFMTEIKDFIAGLFAQQMTEIRIEFDAIHQDITGIRQDITGVRQDINRLDAKIDSVEINLSKKIDDLSALTSDTFEATNQAHDKEFRKYIKRLLP